MAANKIGRFCGTDWKAGKKIKKLTVEETHSIRSLAKASGCHHLGVLEGRPDGSWDGQRESVSGTGDAFLLQQDEDEQQR